MWKAIAIVIGVAAVIGAVAALVPAIAASRRERRGVVTLHGLIHRGGTVARRHGDMSLKDEFDGSKRFIFFSPCLRVSVVK